jgi:hypothetical protein
MREGLVPVADVTTHDGTVFISYARADDKPPPYEEKVPGWITFFWQQLRWELTNVGLAHADLWRDRYEIDPNERFTDKIEAALKAAKFVIMILSPNWPQSKWCLEEASYFARLHPGDAIEKTVLVKKIELPLGIKIPDEVRNILENREGYKFFEKDTSGYVKDFYWRGLQNRDAYYDLILKIARWIADKMMLTIPPPPTPKGKAVYLAAPADELRDAWQRLANDLERSGYTVLPAGGQLPDTAQAVETTVRDALAKSIMAVHLLGDGEEMKPDGGDETIVQLQLRLARERQPEAGVFTRILWAPKWLADRSKGKRDPFDVLQHFGGLQPGEEIYAEEVTDLSQWLRGRLDGEGEKGKQGTPSANGPSSSMSTVPTLLVASAHPDDDEEVTTLANRLQSAEIKIRRFLAGDRIVPDEAVVIIPWGKADNSAISSLLTALEPLKPILLHLPGGDEAAKRRFFREGTYSERVDALPPDRKSGRDLLVRLGILS